jgi:hypothetical protein
MECFNKGSEKKWYLSEDLCCTAEISNYSSMKMLIIIVAMLIFDVSESSSKEQLIF